MKLVLTSDQVEKIITALKSAGNKEIGGQIFGEQLAISNFRATELTVQSRPGSFAKFVVDLLQAAKDAVRFFDKTKHQYTRYNYIGEWHSHPSFAVQPSGPDILTMLDIVHDQRFVGGFAVLMIVRLDKGEFTAGAWVFDTQGGEYKVTLEIEIES